MKILPQLLETLPDGQVVDVRIGLHWTAVVVDVAGSRGCGLCATLSAGHNHGEKGSPNVPAAGKLVGEWARDLAALALDPSPTQTSLGIAALNALLPRRPDLWQDANAEHRQRNSGDPANSEAFAQQHGR